MSKRKRELTQRLEDLFSTPARLEDLFSTPADSAPSEEPPLAPGSGRLQPVQTLASNADPSFLAKLFDHIPLPIYVKDREHKWVAANPAFCQIMHRQADQLIGRADKVQSDDDWQQDDHVLETGQPAESEISLTDDSGLVQCRSISRLPLLDQDGQAQFVIGLMPPVTRSKPVDLSNIEEEILKRNRELAAINQISQALAARTDLRTAIQQVGNIVSRLFNVSEAYIALYDQTTNMLELPFFIEGNRLGDIPPIPLGQGLSSIVIQSRQPLLINHDTVLRARELGAIITGKPAQSYLGVPILADDEAIGVISIQSVETPGLFNADDERLLSTLAANIGTTIRNAKLFQEAQQAEQRFRVIADTTPTPILISRAADGRVLYANERLGPMFDISADELVGQVAPNFYYDPADREKLEEQVRREGCVTHHEVHVKKMDGTPFWSLISIEPMVFNGEPAIVSSFYDITERKLAEGQVLQRNMQLAVLNRISQKLSHLAEPAEICELLYEEMGRILNNENLYIALHDEATNIISFPVYTIDGQRHSNPSRPFGHALTEHIIRTKEPLLIPRNVMAEIEKLGIATSGRTAQTWMGAPLLVGEKAIGVIAVQDYTKPDAFQPDQLEVLTTIASQAAIALENARLFTRTQQELAERKLAEAELRASEARYRSIIENIADGYYEIDRRGNLTFFNEALPQIFGYPKDELMGMNNRQYTEPAEAEKLYQAFNQVYKSGEPVRGFAWEIIQKDGTKRFIEASVSLMRNPAGAATGFRGMVRDINERKQTEEAIQRRVDQLAALNQLVQQAPTAESLREFLQEKSPSRQENALPEKEAKPRQHTPILYESDRMGYAFSEDEIHSFKKLDANTLNDNDKDKDALNVPLMASGQGIGELLVAPADKRTWTSDEISLAQAVAERVSLQVQNLRLLTATEQARFQAETSNRRFTHESWDSYLDAINQKERIGYSYDQGSVASFDEKISSRDGFTQPLSVTSEQVGTLFVKHDPAHPLTENDKELINSTARQLTQQIESLRLLADASRARAEAEEATRRLTRESWQSYAAQQEEAVLSFVYDSNQVTPFGESPLPQDIAITQPLKVRGETIGQLAVAGWKNVSPEAADLAAAIAAQTSIHLETLRLTEELQKRAAELQEMDRLKSAFLANMSHELRTPLNSILGFSDVMLDGLDGPLTDVMENDLKLISRNGQHLLSLINDVLDMAKIEAGKMNLNIERFNLHEVLADVVDITAPLARDKSLALQLEAEASPAIELEADRIRLRQVMINLVGNSIKFTEAGSVTLTAAQQNGHIRISVRDTGIGVPPEHAQMIFEEFHQVDTSTTRKTGGTGLGLPISRKLIELHGGQLWVESTGVRGEGSTFIIELPVTREAKHD